MPTSDHPSHASQRRVSLVKGRHRWDFTFAPGDEPEVLRSVAELAARPNVPFDHFDAALVGHQIAARLNPGLKRLPGSPDGPGKS